MMWKGMANFLHTTYCAEVSEAILKMQAVTITVDDQPPLKTDPTTNQPLPLASWEKYKWRQDYAEQSKKLKLYTDSIFLASNFQIFMTVYLHINLNISTVVKYL